MTYRPSDLPCKDCSAQSELYDQYMCDATNEGCPVINESGSICGESNSFSVFEEFRQIYDEFINQMEKYNGSSTLRILAPLRTLLEDLWEQNTMLVETVEEIEQEAACRLTNMQDKLKKSCQKVKEYQSDLENLYELFRRYMINGSFDRRGLKFNHISPEEIYDEQTSSSNSILSRFRSGRTTFREPESASLKKNSSYIDVKRDDVDYGEYDNLKVKRSGSLIQESIGSYALLDNIKSAKLQIVSPVGPKPEETCDPNDCWEHLGPININLNFRGDSLMDSNEFCNCDCCCESDI